MNNKYKNTSFLIEFLINMLVFIFLCTILLSLFAKAKLISENSSEKANAAEEIYNIFESMRAEQQSSLLLNSTQIILFYNNKWEAVNADSASYLIIINIDAAEHKSGIIKNLYAKAYKSNSEEEFLEMETSIYFKT